MLVFCGRSGIPISAKLHLFSANLHCSFRTEYLTIGKIGSIVASQLHGAKSDCANSILLLEKTMKLSRREFLNLAAGTATLPAASHVSWAQSYPSRPVRIISGFPPGGVNDLHARLFGQWLSEWLGQQFIIEN